MKLSLALVFSLLLFLLSAGTTSSQEPEPLEEPALSAQQTLDQALENARAQDQGLFLLLGHTGHPWMEVFAEYHADPEVSAILDPAIQVTEIDPSEATGGEEFYQQFVPPLAESMDDALPGWVLLNAQGEVVGDSGTIVGKPRPLPVSEEEFAGYTQALQQAGLTLTDEQAALLRQKAVSISRMQRVADWLATMEGWVWGLPLIILLLGTHVFLTFRLGFIQKYLGKMIRLSVVTEKEGEGDVHHFGALSTAMASTVGTGNIVGVAVAILAGGPGAIVWMWLTGVFGIATKYGEAVLSIKFRQQGSKGQMYGGPMFVLEHGLNMKWLGVIFAVFTAIAAFGIGNAVQTFTLADMVEKSYGIPHIVTGGVVAVLTALVILGGIKSISKVCQGLVPLMVLVYVIGCLIILSFHITEIPAAVGLIFKEAFSPSAVAGGALGSLFIVVQSGVARGLFSNEAGLGSAPMVAAAAQTPNPVRQALVSASATFWDTVVICLITGITFVVSGAYAGAVEAKTNANSIAESAFGQIPGVGSTLLIIALATFVFSTILGWSYYGEVAMEYLFGEKSIIFYRIVWVVAVFGFALTKLDVVWAFAGIMNGLMAVPNLIALLALSGLIVSETKRFIDEPDRRAKKTVDAKSQP